METGGGPPASLPSDFSTCWCGSSSPRPPPGGAGSGGLGPQWGPPAWALDGCTAQSEPTFCLSSHLRSSLHQVELRKSNPAVPTDPSHRTDSTTRPPRTREDSA